MNINYSENVLSELKIALSYYIKGLTVKETSTDFFLEVQRITENALLSYSVIDFRKNNFLEPDISITNKYIIIDLNNEHCKHSPSKKHIKIKVPYIDKRVSENPDIKTNYVLGGLVEITISKD